MPARGTNGKVLVHQLFKNLDARSPGGGTSWTYIEVPAEAIGMLGPRLEQIRAHHRTVSASANVEWKIVFYWSVDGASWTGPLDLFSAVSSDGSDISTPYTTTDNFGIQMRYAVGVRASTGTAVEGAILSTWLEFRFLS